MFKILTLAGGLAGAAGLSQYPEFSQQYIQRMGGQIEALSQVVADFDATALRSGLTRSQALDQMQGTQFIEDRRDDMMRTFLRHEILVDNFAHLQMASPLERMAMPHRLGDRELLQGTWSDYKPALPLTLSGAICAGVGFVGGAGVLAGLLGLLRLPFRRRRQFEDVSI